MEVINEDKETDKTPSRPSFCDGAVQFPHSAGQSGDSAQGGEKVSLQVRGSSSLCMAGIHQQPRPRKRDRQVSQRKERKHE